MKRLLAVLAVVAVAGMLGAADKKAESPAAPAVKKTTMFNFAKGDMFGAGNGTLVEEHLQGKEKIRFKVNTGSLGDSGAGNFGMTKCVDWSEYNSIVFNVFVDGKVGWKGSCMVGDKASWTKWTMNYCEMNVMFKPGENKDVHINCEGLFAANSGRALDMKNIQVFLFYGPDQKMDLYFGNIYLVNEAD